jgi:hypothetical protein
MRVLAKLLCVGLIASAGVAGCGASWEKNPNHRAGRVDRTPTTNPDHHAPPRSHE